MSNTRTYFILCRPEQINGRLAAHGGKLLVNLLNYTELLVDRPVVADESMQVFEVDMDVEQVRVQQEGARALHLVWAGEKHARNRPNELVSVPVRSTIPFASSFVPNKLDPVAAAGAVFAGFPPAVQLGATVLNVDDVTLAAVGLNPGPARAWAQSQVQKAQAAG